MRYTKLTSVATRRRFDPSNAADVEELKFYLENGRWRNHCPFYVEYPWEDIPIMCNDKYVRHVLLSK